MTAPVTDEEAEAALTNLACFVKQSILLFDAQQRHFCIKLSDFLFAEAIAGFDWSRPVVMKYDTVARDAWRRPLRAVALNIDDAAIVVPDPEHVIAIAKGRLDPRSRDPVFLRLARSTGAYLDERCNPTATLFTHAFVAFMESVGDFRLYLDSVPEWRELFLKRPERWWASGNERTSTSKEAVFVEVKHH